MPVPDNDVIQTTNEIFRYLWRRVSAGYQPEYSDYEPLLLRYLPGDGQPVERKRRAVINRVEAALDYLKASSPEKLYQKALFSIDNEVCDCDGTHHCRDACVVDAIVVGKNGKIHIDPDCCIDCGQCYRACRSGAISECTHLLQLAKLLRDRNQHAVYAIVAPSFAGQFKGYTYTALKSYLLALGFDDVWEVALAADIITVQEAKEFVRYWQSGRKFMITSCCCPAFIKLVERHQPSISHLVSDSVSPMIAMGRILKAQDPTCKVVFIGPCLAKRGEINRPEFRGDVDVVLTYRELKDVVMTVHPDTNAVRQRDTVMREASRDGRSYAYSGGVTRAITNTIVKLLPEAQNLRTIKGNGLKECSHLLNKLADGKLDAHFMEGMGCPGGCVGGSGTNMLVCEAEEHVEMYADSARVQHAYDNEVADAFWGHLKDRISLYALKKGDRQ